MTVYAPALSIDYCTSILAYINYSEPFSAFEQKVFEESTTVLTDRTVFGVGIAAGFVNTSTECLVVQTKLADDSVTATCAGYLNQTQCYLRSALGEYDVIVSNGSVRFAQPPSNPRIISYANNTSITKETIAKFNLHYPGSPEWIRSTLSGIATTISYQYDTFVGLAPSLSAGDTPILASGSSQLWFPWQHIENYAAWDNGETCAPAFSDPRDNVMASLNELMFHMSNTRQISSTLIDADSYFFLGTGVYTAQHYNESYLESRIDDGLKVSYKAMATPLSPVDVFHSDFAYFAGAAVVEGIYILAVLFTFYGWWNLGRHMSFSPLEIAKVKKTLQYHCYHTGTFADL